MSGEYQMLSVFSSVLKHIDLYLGTLVRMKKMTYHVFYLMRQRQGVLLKMAGIDVREDQAWYQNFVCEQQSRRLQLYI